MWEDFTITLCGIGLSAAIILTLAELTLVLNLTTTTKPADHHGCVD